jgi:hypothetical protein
VCEQQLRSNVTQQWQCCSVRLPCSHHGNAPASVPIWLRCGVSIHAGKQLLTVWDKLCVLLRARAVSVEDVSNKSGMLLRVLHTAAFGTTW